MTIFGDAGSPSTDFVKSIFNSGQLIVIVVLLFIAIFTLFLIIMYFVRKKLPAEDRKSKVLRLK
jgi:hypothetical protein